MAGEGENYHMPRRRERLERERRQHEARAIKHVATYIRVSTDEQARSGLGLADQVRRCAGMAEAKGWPEPVVYADEGVSGTVKPDKRKGFARLLEDMRSGKIDAVIVLDLSRLARRTRYILDTSEEIDTAGASLVSCKESLDTTTAHGRFALTIFAALTQLERDLIADRTRAALREHDFRDGESGGRLPYGYIRVDKQIEINREQAAVIRLIIRKRKRGESLHAIAAYLNDLGVPGPQGGVWWASSVREIFENEAAYKGGKRGASDVRWPRLLGKQG